MAFGGADSGGATKVPHAELIIMAGNADSGACSYGDSSCEMQMWVRNLLAPTGPTASGAILL